MLYRQLSIAHSNIRVQSKLPTPLLALPTFYYYTTTTTITTLLLLPGMTFWSEFPERFRDEFPAVCELQRHDDDVTANHSRCGFALKGNRSIWDALCAIIVETLYLYVRITAAGYTHTCTLCAPSR